MKFNNSNQDLYSKHLFEIESQKLAGDFFRPKLLMIEKFAIIAKFVTIDGANEKDSHRHTTYVIQLHFTYSVEYGRKINYWLV